MKIEKLPSGNYRTKVQIEGKRYSITRSSRKDVLAAVAELQDTHRPVQNLTLGEAIDRYIEDRAAVLSPSTVRGYKSIRDSRFDALMSKKVTAITDRDLQKAVSDEAKVCSPKTLKNSWGLLGASLSYAGRTPPSVKLPAPEPKDARFLQPEQIQPFLRSIRGQRGELEMILALHSLRVSEILAMKRENITDKEILVRGACVLDDKNNLIAKKTNKVAASTRNIPILIPQLRDALADREGLPLIELDTSIKIYYAVTHACERAGLPKLSPHCLRHTFASLCWSLGVDEVTTMRLGGWTDYQTMRKIYTHLAASTYTAGVDKLTAFFDPKPEK